MRIMTKIKDLLAGREKLAKYDELTEWKKYFERNVIANLGEDNGFSYKIQRLPDHIKDIIVSALDAEIAKLDEE